ncbi:hypothetical protein BSKO_01554 [Bryopsis sp. KO-2023]|nr:hypothetical protein BSKO_01554 [Bryopsis sp. KO-2023]
MGSLMSGWGGPTAPAPLSVEEELKIHQVELERKSLTRNSLERKSSAGAVEEKHPMLLKVAEKQHLDEGGPVGVPPQLTRRSSEPPVLGRKSAPVMKVKIRGHQGATVVLQSEPVTPGAGSPHGEEEEEYDLKNKRDKWWRKLSSSALNELERERADDSTGPSSYVPQFDLTGSNPYDKEVEST